MPVRVQEAASVRLDEIYRYTRDRWGADQADRYLTDLFAAFELIVCHGVASRPIPAEFGVEGFYFRHEHHFVYWRRLSAHSTEDGHRFHAIVGTHSTASRAAIPRDRGQLI